MLVAVVVVGVIAICAMEGLSEMIQRFPTVNPIVELVHEFVDQDLALCVGVAYWSVAIQWTNVFDTDPCTGLHTPRYLLSNSLQLQVT